MTVARGCSRRIISGAGKTRAASTASAASRSTEGPRLHRPDLRRQAESEFAEEVTRTNKEIFAVEEAVMKGISYRVDTGRRCLLAIGLGHGLLEKKPMRRAQGRTRSWSDASK